MNAESGPLPSNAQMAARVAAAGSLPRTSSGRAKNQPWNRPTPAARASTLSPSACVAVSGRAPRSAAEIGDGLGVPGDDLAAHRNGVQIGFELQLPDGRFAQERVDLVSR